MRNQIDQLKYFHDRIIHPSIASAIQQFPLWNSDKRKISPDRYCYNPSAHEDRALNRYGIGEIFSISGNPMFINITESPFGYPLFTNV